MTRHDTTDFVVLRLHIAAIQRLQKRYGKMTHKSHSLMVHSSPWDLRRDALLDDLSADVICVDDYFTLEISFMDLVATAAELLRQIEGVATVRIQGFSNSEYFLYFGAGDRVGLVQIRRDAESDPLARERATFFVATCGERSISLAVTQKLRKRFGTEKFARVVWWWLQKGEPQRRSIVLDKSKPVYREFYPWIADDIDDYFDRYLSSGASILFMMGPAGTGKTSLIRHFIHTNHIGAMVTYEDDLLETDAMFVDFLTSKSEDVLVVEDADLMLGSREHAGNKLVARFLNISDGLVKFGGKKIIFTTNLDDFKNVDAALVRPGRCFDALAFRALTHAESIAAAKAAGLPIPLAQESRTLAQLFNQVEKPMLAKRKVDF